MEQTPSSSSPTPSPQRRHADSLAADGQNLHRRSTDPQRRSSDFNNARTSILSHPGTFLMGIGGIVFAAYIFNFAGTGTSLDRLFSHWNNDARAQNHTVQSGLEAAIPYAIAFIAIVVLYAILKGISTAITANKTKRQLAPRREITVEEFVQHVGRKGISPTVAREAFKLLLPHYRNRMRTRMTDSLATVLQLNRVQIADLYANLLYQSDRHIPDSDEEVNADTVLELLTLVENATPRSTSDTPFVPPMPRRKGLSRLTGIFIPPAHLAAARAATPPKPTKGSNSKIKINPGH